jgi:AAA+ superfamily predicted ATPase
MRGSFADWEDELDVTLRAGAPIVWLESDEEPRAIAAIERSSARAQRSVALWSCARGLHPLRSSAIDTRTQDPLAALDAFAKMDARAVLVLLDVAPFLAQALLARRLREAPSSLASQGKAIVMVGAGPCPLAELRAESARVLAAPPTSEELARVARALAANTLDDDAVRAIVTAAKGLRTDAFALALRRAIVRFDRVDHRAVEEVRREGARAIHDGALLEPIDTDASLDRLGGLDALKRWLDLRARALSDEARSFGVDAPRGVFVVGVQGGGKSTCARAVAARWGLPLLRFDIGRVFHGIVGASEANVRRALAQAESSAPCVLWLDEVNRGLSDVSGRGDSGIGGRVFATLLTWLQDRAAPVFVVATANDVSALPPELLRKGRFDEVFFVDLPTRVERSEIARIHLARRGRAPGDFDLDALADACDAFSGAEIEQCIVTALLYAFSEGRPLAQADVVRAARETVPLAKTARESVEALRRWAQGRARPASSMRDAIDHRVVL